MYIYILIYICILIYIIYIIYCKYNLDLPPTRQQLKRQVFFGIPEPKNVMSSCVVTPGSGVNPMYNSTVCMERSSLQYGSSNALLSIILHTLHETNVALKIGHPKRKGNFIFQPSIFRAGQLAVCSRVPTPSLSADASWRNGLSLAKDPDVEGGVVSTTRRRLFSSACTSSCGFFVTDSIRFESIICLGSKVEIIWATKKTILLSMKYWLFNRDPYSSSL